MLYNKVNIEGKCIATNITHLFSLLRYNKHKYKKKKMSQDSDFVRVG